MTEKLQLAERLIKEGKLTLEEAFILMDRIEDKSGTDFVQYYVYPYQVWPQPYQPLLYSPTTVAEGVATTGIVINKQCAMASPFSYTN